MKIKISLYIFNKKQEKKLIIIKIIYSYKNYKNNLL